MDKRMARALVAAARAFADAIEATDEDESEAPARGSAESMRVFLRRVLDVNEGEGRGVTQSESAQFAREAGMDPRGVAGYYPAGLLEMGDDGRHVTDIGKKRLEHLEAT